MAYTRMEKNKRGVITIAYEKKRNAFFCFFLLYDICIYIFNKMKVRQNRCTHLCPQIENLKYKLAVGLILFQCLLHICFLFLVCRCCAMRSPPLFSLKNTLHTKCDNWQKLFSLKIQIIYIHTYIFASSVCFFSSFVFSLRVRALVLFSSL